MPIRLRHIEVFDAIMRTGSITAAAEVLRTSQPTASRVIAELEGEVGFQLFFRGRGKVTPTPEARHFHGEVQRSFIGLEQIEVAAHHIANFRSGHLRVAAVPSMSISIVPAAIKTFVGHLDGVNVTLDVHPSDGVIEGVASRQFDVGVAVPPVHPPDVQIVGRAKSEAVCAMPNGHALASEPVVHARQLADLPFISLRSGYLSRQRIDRIFERLAIRRRMILETQAGSVVCALAREGLGVSIVDPFTASVFADQGLTLRPFRPPVWLEFVTVTSGIQQPTRLTESFVSILQQTLDSTTTN